MPSRKKKLERKLNRRDSSTGSSSLQTWIESSSKPAVMSSFSYQMSERLECSICLEVFSDPVSTPCGHNFCKICLSRYWNSSQDCRCPNCKETFDQRPDLRINTTLRELVDEHKKKTHEEQAEAEVVCDICTEGKLKAVKSCLVCQSSFCETHLEPHLRVSGLQKHKLIDPVKNLQDYICQKHKRPLELFCRDDQTRVCLICTVTDHKNHNTVPIRESELQEMMEERPRGAETHDERVIKYLEQEISEMKKRNIKLQSIAEMHRAAETQHECLIRDLKKEITEIQWRNNEMEMVKQKQKIAENVLKLRDQEIRNRDQEIIELKKTDAELKMRDAELKKRDAELKKRDDELKKRDDELVMVKQKKRTAENFIKVRDQEITQLKKINTELKMRDGELVMVLMKQKTAERQYENTIRDRDQEITELKKRDAELVMVKQKQRTAENVITVQDQEIRHRDQEITELKKRDDEQQQKISNTENNLLLLQEQHQEHLRRQKKFSSEDLCSRIIGIVLLVLYIIASARLELLQKGNSDLETDKAARFEFTELQKRNCGLETDKAELRMKWMQQFAVDVTLDPDTAHPGLTLSDDKKQVRAGDIYHKLPDNPKRFDIFPSVLSKEGFSSGRFYYEVQVKGNTDFILGVIRESVNRKGLIPLTPDDGIWRLWMINENVYIAGSVPSVSLSMSVTPQKVGVFVDYEEGLVAFYDVESRSHIYSFTDQCFTEKLYPFFGSYLNSKIPLIITPVIK